MFQLLKIDPRLIITLINFNNKFKKYNLNVFSFKIDKENDNVNPGVEKEIDNANTIIEGKSYNNNFLVERTLDVINPNIVPVNNHDKHLIDQVLSLKLKHQGYKLVGSHAAVKICGWTKSQVNLNKIE